MTENEIALHVARYVFPCRRFLCVCNSNQFLSWEADLLVMSPAGWLYEIEIKSNVADLKRDSSKRKHKFLWGHPGYPYGPSVRKFYYAMPLRVYQKVEAAPPIPEHAGIITINDKIEIFADRSEIVREAKPNQVAHKLTDRERYKLARLGCIRYWLRKEVDIEK